MNSAQTFTGSHVSLSRLSRFEFSIDCRGKPDHIAFCYRVRKWYSESEFSSALEITQSVEKPTKVMIDMEQIAQRICVV